MQINHCVNCENQIETYPCPHCGFDAASYRQPEYALPCNTVLHGRYLTGKVLGQGGFGITYVGWDLVLQCKCAIKEYYPNGQAVRKSTIGLELCWSDGVQAENLRKTGMESFLKEARKMNKADHIPQVVRVRDTFIENETAYIVMDFVEGRTLKDRLEKGGVLSWEEAKTIFFPVISAMEQVHQVGIIHRDLSPDNLMLLPDGSVKILDLGAAKDLSANNGLSSMQVAKNGFSPIEQYTQRGGTGSWSDVYSLAATMYISITGVLPLSAVDRVTDDTLAWDLPGLLALPKAVRHALQKAMTVLPADRTRSMGEFLSQLRQSTPAPVRHSEPKPKSSRKRIPLLAAAGVAVVVLCSALSVGTWAWKDASMQAMEPEENAPVIPETEEAVEDTTENWETYEVPAPITPKLSSSDNKSWVNGGTFSYSMLLLPNGEVRFDGHPSGYVDPLPYWTDIRDIAAGYPHAVALRNDGTVVTLRRDSTETLGADDLGECDVGDWKEITTIAAGDYFTVGVTKEGRLKYAGDSELYTSCFETACREWSGIASVSPSRTGLIGLKRDGTVVWTGAADDPGYTAVKEWKDITAVDCGNSHAVGLTRDGRVLAAGLADATDGQCDVSDWKNITAIAAGDNYTVGLTEDGHVLAVGNNESGQCDVSDWEDIIAIDVQYKTTYGLRKDNIVLEAGPCDEGAHIFEQIAIASPVPAVPEHPYVTDFSADYSFAMAATSEGDVLMNGYVYLIEEDPPEIYADQLPKWDDVKAVAADSSHAAVLKKDGTVEVIGPNQRGECDVENWRNIVAIDYDSCTVGVTADGHLVYAGDPVSSIKDACNSWSDIVDISLRGFNILGLKRDGTVVWSEERQQPGLENWQDISQIACGHNFAVGLTRDGHVMAVHKYDDYGASAVEGWENIKAVAAGYSHTIAMTEDGHVLAVGDNSNGQCNVEDWVDIVAIAAGDYSTFGLKADGTILATGMNARKPNRFATWPIP